MPKAGSGSSGGTSSAGRFTSHVSSGCPYRHRFSLSIVTKKARISIERKIERERKKERELELRNASRKHRDID
jgi:hypothetical protein